MTADDERQAFIDHAMRYGFDRLRVLCDVQLVENMKGLMEPVLVQRGLRGPVYGIKWDDQNQDILATVSDPEHTVIYNWKV